MGLFATKNKGDLKAVKKELKTVLDSFFIPYKADSDRINKSIDILKGAVQELKSFEKKLKETVKEGEMFPEFLSDEEKKEIQERIWKTPKATQEEIDLSSVLEEELLKETLKKSAFGRVLDELRTFLDGVLTISLTNYELQVIKPLKEFLDVLNALINKVNKQITEKYYIVKFSSSEFDALKELFSYTFEYVDQLEQDCDAIITDIIGQKKYRPGEGQILERVKATKLLDDYVMLLRKNEERIRRLNDYIKLITDSIKLINRETIRLFKAL